MNEGDWVTVQNLKGRWRVISIDQVQKNALLQNRSGRYRRAMLIEIEEVFNDDGERKKKH